jgi:hypothetical protein
VLHAPAGCGHDTRTPSLAIFFCLTLSMKRGCALRPQVAALHHATRHVCQLACEVEADADKFPPTWLFHHR